MTEEADLRQEGRELWKSKHQPATLSFCDGGSAVSGRRFLDSAPEQKVPAAFACSRSWETKQMAKFNKIVCEMSEISIVIAKRFKSLIYE